MATQANEREACRVCENSKTSCQPDLGSSGRRAAFSGAVCASCLRLPRCPIHIGPIFRARSCFSTLRPSAHIQRDHATRLDNHPNSAHPPFTCSLYETSNFFLSDHCWAARHQSPSNSRWHPLPEARTEACRPTGRHSLMLPVTSREVHRPTPCAWLIKNAVRAFITGKVPIRINHRILALEPYQSAT